MDPVSNRLATTRRRGRPSLEEAATRPPPAPARTDATGRLLCPHCGRPDLSSYGNARKSDGAMPHRCSHCGYRCVRLVLLSQL